MPQLTATKPEHSGIVALAETALIPWGQILAWLEKYGFPAFMQVLQLVLPLLAGKKIDTAKLIQWIETALAAIASGQPLPPLPVLP